MLGNRSGVVLDVTFGLELIGKREMHILLSRNAVKIEDAIDIALLNVTKHGDTDMGRYRVEPEEPGL